MSSPIVALAIPLVTGLILATAPRRAIVRDFLSFAGAGLLLTQVMGLRSEVLAGNQGFYSLGEFLPGYAIAFRAEAMGLIYALVAASLWMVASVYSAGYLRANKERHTSRFAASFSLSIAASMGVAFSDNLLTMFICYEALSLSTYPLVTHHGDRQSIAAGRRYLGILMGASILLFLPAMLWIANVAHTTDFVAGGILQGTTMSLAENQPVLTVLYACICLGAAKAALMPLHRWLPAAMVAPAPVSALLHAVAVVKAGVFVILKTTAFTFGLGLLAETQASLPIAYLAGFTIVVASMIAIVQNNLKRRLAYSTISQLGYITLGAALAHPLALAGACMHVGAHAFGKITLFFAAGAIHTSTHKHDVDELDGIGKTMPWTTAAVSVAIFSMIGIPLTAGFWSKWYLLAGAWQADANWAIGVLMVSTILNCLYFLPIIYRAVFLPAKVDAHHHGGHHGHGHGDDHEHAAPDFDGCETPRPMLVALVTTAGVTAALFFVPGIFMDLVNKLLETL